MDFSKFKIDSGTRQNNAELEEARAGVVSSEGVESGFSEVSRVTEELEWNDEELVEVDELGGAEAGESSLEDRVRSGLEYGFGSVGDGTDFLSQLDDLLSDDEEFEQFEVGGGVGSPVSTRRGKTGKPPRKSEETKERERVRRSSKSKSYGKRKRSLDSSIGERGPKEYLVDGEGRLVRRGSKGVGSSEKFEKLVELADSHGGVSVGESVKGSVGVVGDVEKREHVVYPWSRSREVERSSSRYGGKRGVVNQRELDFYRSVGESREALLRGKLGEELRGRVDGRESRSERTARQSLEARGLGGARGVVRRAGGLTVKDLELLQFLAKFKYATASQLGNLSGVQERSCSNRLQRLQQSGLVESLVLWGSSRVWVLTGAGMLLSGYDLPVQKADKISLANVSHQFVVNHVASNLWGGGVNVLGLDSFPRKNRVDSSGRSRLGEVLVSETEIQSSFSKMRLLDKSEVYRPKVMKEIELGFAKWAREGRVGPSPEFLHGNEYMWKLFPPFNLDLVYHDPDLVVARPRGKDGKPRSIAVEIELNAKEGHRYRKTLLAYKADRVLYGKVIWVCNNFQSAKSLEEISKEIGLWQEGRIDIVPVLTRDGVFEGRDLWLL